VNQAVDLAIQISGTLFVYLYPVILLALFVTPFIFVYLRHKKITLLSGLVSTLVGVALVALALFGTYWGLAYLQGYAARNIYGY
jgi:hypothetical protein